MNQTWMQVLIDSSSGEGDGGPPDVTGAATVVTQGFTIDVKAVPCFMYRTSRAPETTTAH